MTTVIYIILSIAAAFLLYVFVFLFPGFKEKHKYNKMLFTDYAHRGLHDAESPENSLAAFRKAVEAGYGIELDVQFSKDGEVMVFHDYSLERMTGDSRKLSELTAAELKELSLKDSGEKIPYLTEVLEVVGGKIPLIVELKGESFDTSLCPKVDSILSDYAGAYCIESFNPMLLRWYKKNRKSVMRGILTTKASRERGFTPLNFLLDTMTLNILSRPDFIAYDHRYNKFSVKICTMLFGIPGFTWTVRDEETYSRIDPDTCVIFEGFCPDRCQK